MQIVLAEYENNVTLDTVMETQKREKKTDKRVIREMLFKKKRLVTLESSNYYKNENSPQ